MEFTDLVLVRGLERLLIVAVAGLSIVLGYHLFKIVPVDRNSSGEFKALNMSIVVSKVGPGVFFAAFGALVLGISVMTQLSVTPGGPVELAQVQTLAAQEAPPSTVHYQTVAPQNYTYAGRSIEPTATMETVNRVKDQIAFLNCAATHAEAGLAPAVADTMRASVDAAAASMLREVWQPEWGEKATLDKGKTAETVEAILAAKSTVCLADVLKVEAN